MSGPAAWLRASRRALGQASPLELSLRLGLVVLLLDASYTWTERLPVLAIAGLGLVLPAALRSPGLWLALAAITGATVARQFPLPDNHAYLAAFFCLAAACALATRDPRAAFARSARLLVGLTFAFAVLWKLFLSPDFRDGRFFRVTLLTDSRFENLAVLAGGMTWERWEANGERLDAALSGRRDFGAEPFDEPAALRRLAWMATLYTGVAEILVATAFLWPGSRGPARLRDAALLGFLLPTYTFATVRGFGWLLVSLGMAQSRSGWVRGAYLGAFLWIEVHRSVPWSDALVQALGRG